MKGKEYRTFLREEIKSVSRVIILYDLELITLLLLAGYFVLDTSLHIIFKALVPILAVLMYRLFRLRQAERKSLKKDIHRLVNSCVQPSPTHTKTR